MDLNNDLLLKQVVRKPTRITKNYMNIRYYFITTEINENQGFLL